MTVKICPSVCFSTGQDCSLLRFSAGQEYDELTPTIMITILNYPLFPRETDQFHTIFQLSEVNEHFIWSPHLEYHAFDLTNFMVKWKKY